MKILRYILFPVVPVYYLVTELRNKLYDLDIKKSKSYNFPVICVGNLSVGGTGKTPMIEYLIRLLKDNYALATLSRGYKRSTNGFVLADKTSDASTLGDEPYQFYKKFNEVIVSVDANRQNGINQLITLPNKPEVILLDDAYQHRKVKAGFNILLTSYDCLYANDIVLPTGNLREPKAGAHRADIIVVTKCPENITEKDKKNITNTLKPLKHQQLFFSTIKYSNVIKSYNSEKPLSALKGVKFTLVTGIANAKPLVDFLKENALVFEHLNYKDHYEFSDNDIERLKKKELILTTEKDFMRLEPYFKTSENVFYLPIEMCIDDALNFNERIKNFIDKY